MNECVSQYIFCSLLPDFHYLHFFSLCICSCMHLVILWMWYKAWRSHMYLNKDSMTVCLDRVRKLQKLYIIYVIFSISENLQPLSLAGLVKITENIIQPVANSIKSQLEESTKDLGMEGILWIYLGEIRHIMYFFQFQRKVHQ